MGYAHSDGQKGDSILETGIKGQMEWTVDKTLTASAYGSGLLDVFATPAMVALVEGTALTSVLPYLEEGKGTVGTKVNVEHLAATPVGMKVRCETELIEIDRRRLVFRADVYDECGLIGTGTHERFIIDNEKFMQKTSEKANQTTK